jgi:tRNA 2-selenouridine synthase
MIKEFLESPGVILDVRSPSEYLHGHIPGAINLPLFTNTERAQVGTTYKQIGKQQAIDLGLKIVGPKLHDFVEKARHHAPNGKVKVHCWRGGMRSSSMAWLLQTAGMSTTTLPGGYKTFRTWALSILKTPLKLQVIGGFTGSGKTEILTALEKNGEQVLDLEAIANHRGSSYGMISSQPTDEQFVNDLAVKWASFNPARPLWIEDESRLIGKCFLPADIYHQMRAAPLFLIERSLPERIEFLLKEYCQCAPDILVKATERLSKRLGSLRTKSIIEFIQTGNFIEAIQLVLQYYDRTYHYGIELRKQAIQRIPCDGLCNTKAAEKLLTFCIH